MSQRNTFISFVIIILQITTCEIYSQSGNAKSLEVGNKWIYKSWSRTLWDSTEYSYKLEEVVKDTVINNYIYAIINHQPNYGNSYERADSMQIYSYSVYDDSEYVIVNFHQTDTVFADGSSIEVDTINYWGKDRIRTTNHTGPLSLGDGSISYIEGIGKENNGSTSPGGYSSGEYIIAAYLDGIIFGDSTLVGVERNEQIPSMYELFQNYPNPFNSKTTFKFIIPIQTKVMLSIYTINGEKVVDLVNRELFKGSYQIGFDFSNISSGIYFYQLRTANFLRTKKLVYLK